MRVPALVRNTMGDEKKYDITISDRRSYDRCEFRPLGLHVLSFGEFLKIRNKLFAIPWEGLGLDPLNKQFILNVGRTSWRTRPASTRTIGQTWQIPSLEQTFTDTTATSPIGKTSLRSRSAWTRDTRRKADLPTSISITTERNNHETVHIA